MRKIEYDLEEGHLAFFWCKDGKLYSRGIDTQKKEFVKNFPKFLIYFIRTMSKWDNKIEENTLLKDFKDEKTFKIINNENIQLSKERYKFIKEIVNLKKRIIELKINN